MALCMFATVHVAAVHSSQFFDDNLTGLMYMDMKYIFSSIKHPSMDQALYSVVNYISSLNPLVTQIISIISFILSTGEHRNLSPSEVTLLGTCRTRDQTQATQHPPRVPDYRCQHLGAWLEWTASLGHS